MPYEWGEHVGELELHVSARDEPGVFAEAARAVGELLGDAEVADTQRYEVVATGGERTVLFAAWLAELAFLAETEGLVPVDVDEVSLAPAEVRASVVGFRGDPPHLVKAVTYHRLEYGRRGGVWRARAVLDV